MPSSYLKKWYLFTLVSDIKYTNVFVQKVEKKIENKTKIENKKVSKLENLNVSKIYPKI